MIKFFNGISILSGQATLANGKVVRINFQEKLAEKIEIDTGFQNKQQTNYIFSTNHPFGEFIVKETILDEQSSIYQLVLRGEERLDVSEISFNLGFGEIDFTKILSAPFDNDKWAKFIDYDVDVAKPSYNFTALSGKKQEILLGALDLKDWKTGFVFEDKKVRCISGYTDERTRDFDVPHGIISGKEIASSRILVSISADYQEKFATYGDILGDLYPRDRWEDSVPFGWNSWAALMATLDFDKYLEASNFMAEIQTDFHMEDGKQWVNLDAMWSSFTNKLDAGVTHLKRKNQKAGFYLAPFITTPPFNREMPGTRGKYFFEDALLRNHEGEILRHVDGLYSLDPTHPGTIAYTKYEIERMKDWGYEYVKIDFLGHAAREGKFYNSEITTGMQAFDLATQYMRENLAEEGILKIFVNLSIAPIFCFGFGHSRRISCDAFGSIADSEYVNNSTTYLWWMANRIYEYNDPDHLVLYKSYDMNSISYSEAIMRLNTGIVCGGPIIYSDDFAFPEARERAKHIFKEHPEVLELAYSGETFVPLKGSYSGQQSANIFIRKETNRTLLGLFNYNPAEKAVIELDLNELGYADEVVTLDLYSREINKKQNRASFHLQAGESTIIELRQE